MAAQLTHLDRGVVVSVDNPAEISVLGHLAAQLPNTTAMAVVVDLTPLTMAPANYARDVVDQVRAATRTNRAHWWSLVAARLTARRALRRLCVGTPIGVFPTVDAALAALPFGPAAHR